MSQEVLDKPIDVDKLYSNRPHLFPHMIPSMEKRRTVFVGELVKIVVGIREQEQLVSGRWLIVESVSRTDSGISAVGRSCNRFYSEDFAYTFGPEHIYRMDCRRFYVWGSDGVPVAMRGGDGPNNEIPARPLNSEEQFVEACDEVLVEFSALGYVAAEEHYRHLASQKANWPSYLDLK